MSNVRKAHAWDQAGFDAERNLQVIGLGKRTSFALVAGDGLDVSFEGDDCLDHTVGTGDDKGLHGNSALSGWEKQQILRRVDVKAKALGTTVMHAYFQGSDWIAPLTIRVVSDQQNRQVGKSVGEVTSALRDELQKLSLRDAVIRIAEDQMNSAIASQSNGFGVYNIAANYDWCGAFAYWCWEQACSIKSVSNPFGPKNSVLWSPQRAISYAMLDTTPVQLLRYSGYDPMGVVKDSSTGKFKKQDYRDFGYNGSRLERGDIVLYRKSTSNDWKHVCLVHDQMPPISGMLGTIDGNQGSNACIQTRKRDMDAKVAGGDSCLVFVHAAI